MVWFAGIGNGGFSAEELLKLELETTSQMNGGNPPFDGPDCALVDLVTKNFVECLQVHIYGFTSCGMVFLLRVYGGVTQTACGRSPSFRIFL